MHIIEARTFLARIFKFHSYKYIEGMDAGFQCAGCGEWNDTQLDASAGLRQHYVEDCQVCCKPNVIEARWNQKLEEFELRAELE